MAMVWDDDDDTATGRVNGGLVTLNEQIKEKKSIQRSFDIFFVLGSWHI